MKIVTQNKSIQNLKHNNTGFTLVELLTVAVFLGILTGFALTTFNNNVHTERLNKSSKLLLNYLNHARKRSEETLQQCVVEIDHPTTVVSISNPQTCSGIGEVNLTTSVEGTQSLKVCGTTNPNSTNMRCDANLDQSSDNSGNFSTSTQISFTARGTVFQGGVIKLHSETAEKGRCLVVTSPIGLIREGQDDGNACKLTTQS